MKMMIEDNRELTRNGVAADKRGLWLTLFLLCLFLAFNICTAEIYPFPNVDECMIAEPAINFLHGKGFNVRFSEILAMYSFLLVPWIKLFGESLRSIRSANMTCAATALFVLWLAVKRLALIPKVIWRVLLLFVLATEFWNDLRLQNGEIRRIWLSAGFDPSVRDVHPHEAETPSHALSCLPVSSVGRTPICCSVICCCDPSVSVLPFALLDRNRDLIFGLRIRRNWFSVDGVCQWKITELPGFSQHPAKKRRGPQRIVHAWKTDSP